MTKPKFSIEKAVKAVEISSRIEGHKFPKRKTAIAKRTKTRIKKINVKIHSR